MTATTKRNVDSAVGIEAITYSQRKPCESGHVRREP